MILVMKLPEIYDYLMRYAIQLAFTCNIRRGGLGGAQWDRFDVENQMLFIDRIIDRVDRTLVDGCQGRTRPRHHPNLNRFGI